MQVYSGTGWLTRTVIRLTMLTRFAGAHMLLATLECEDISLYSVWQNRGSICLLKFSKTLEYTLGYPNEYFL